MSTLHFYRSQADQQQAAANAATRDKLRARFQEAADAWTLLAERIEARNSLRDRLAAAREAMDPNENPDRGRANGSPAIARSNHDVKEESMAKGQRKSNKEARKPKKEVTKTIAAKPSIKGLLKS